MGEIWPKTCEQGKDRRDQLDIPTSWRLGSVRLRVAGGVGQASAVEDDRRLDIRAKVSRTDQTRAAGMFAQKIKRVAEELSA